MHVSYVKSYGFGSHCLAFYRLIDMLYFFICFHCVFSYSRYFLILCIFLYIFFNIIFFQFLYFKEMLLSKALTCKNFSCIKMAILSLIRIPLAILLYGQFIHLTKITLRPNIQLFSAQQHAYQSFLSYFLVLFRLQYCGILAEFQIKMLP